VEACGALDELSAALGLASSLLEPDPSFDVHDDLSAIQRDLLRLGAEIATREGRTPAAAPVSGGDVTRLEERIDAIEAGLPAIKRFLLPGGSPAGAALHLARSVCRRAERRAVALSRTEPLRPEVLGYLNRLSDFLFVAARLVNRRTGAGEAVWEGRAEADRP
jgi:cob(I)alamin adenosyltransferase